MGDLFMKWLFGKTGVWISVTVFSAAVAFATGNAQDSERGEQIMNSSCTKCHDLRPIQTTALDEAGWTETVNKMIEKGAEVQKAEIPLFVEYLTRNHGPLPDGPGKAIVLNKCSVCHDLKRVTSHLASPEEWADTLSSMFNEGLMLSDEEFAIVLRYLARNFRQ